jgi:hypothetical protein
MPLIIAADKTGMRWNIPGATSIVTLRCQQASHCWEEIWQRPHSQTPPLTSPHRQADLATYKLAQTHP